MLKISVYDKSIHNIKKCFEFIFGIEEYELFKYENVPSLVLVKDNKVKGFLLLNTYHNKLNKYFISQLGVVPKYQKQGYASSMIKKVQETAEYLELDTYEDNIPAINTYKKCGFIINCRYIIKNNKKHILNNNEICDNVVITLIWNKK